MAPEYIKFIYGIKNYIYNEIVEIEIEESKYKDYLKSINYKGIIGKIKDVEICFLHYDNIVEINEKWKKRLQRINWNRIIYKLNTIYIFMFFSCKANFVFCIKPFKSF